MNDTRLTTSEEMSALTNTDIKQIAEENCMTVELDASAKGITGVRPTTELTEKADAFARS